MVTSFAMAGEKNVTAQPHFLVIKGPQRGTCIGLDSQRLQEKPLIFGRHSSDCDVVLQSTATPSRISRQHAILGYRTADNRLTLTDISSNGTRLNGEYMARYTPLPLLPGDIITCGDVELVYILPLERMGVPLALLPGQLERVYSEDCEPGFARLEVVSTNLRNLRAGSICRLTPQAAFSIGRNRESNDLALFNDDETDLLVSRRHCEIRWLNDSYVIFDKGAANPAWVNQTQLQAAARLEDGNSIQVGLTILRYRAPRLPLQAARQATLQQNSPRFALRYDSARSLLSGQPCVLLPAERQVLIGRTEGNDLRLLDKRVSSHHARLLFEAERYMVVDLGSSNGTFVNNQEILGGVGVVLQPGDKLKMGDFEFIFEEYNPPVPESEPTSDSPEPEVEVADLEQPLTFRMESRQAASQTIANGEPADGGATSQTATSGVLITHPLRKIPPFDELDSERFLQLQPFFKEQHFKVGQEIVKEGRSKGAFFALVEGRIAISRSLNEKQQIIVGELEAGSVYGERTITADKPFANRLEASTNVKALVLDEAIFLREFRNDTALKTFFEQQVAASSAMTWLKAALLMRNFSERTRAEMLRRLRFRVYNKGELLAEKGQPADEFFIILGGPTLVFDKDYKGREQEIAVLEEGDTFGDGIAQPGENYPLYLQAQERTECFVLARADFENVLSRSGDLAAAIGQVSGIPVSAVLSRVAPFNTMPPQLVARIATELRPKFFKKGEVIVRQNENASAFYIIHKGQVQISFRASSGEERTDSQLGPGQYFGEGSLLTNVPRTDTITALENCELLALYRNRLDTILKLGEGYDLAQHFARNLNKSFRPKRKAGVEVSEQTDSAGKPYYLLKLDGGEQFRKLDERGYFLWNLMDGDNSLTDLSMAYFLEFMALDLEGVSKMVAELQATGFLEVPKIDENLVSQGERRQRSTLEKILSWRKQIKNVDQLFDRLYNWGGQVFFWKPLIWLQFAIMLVGLGAFLYWGFLDKNAAARGISQMFAGGGLGALTIPGALPWWGLVLTLFIQMVIHEIAHGLAVKAYGRKIIEGGYGWQYFGLVFYVNTNDIWVEKRKARIVVSLAGPFSNALIAGFCCLLMFLTANPVTQTILFQIAGVGYVLFFLNINPLLELDGYYALMDWLEIPGLRRKAFTYVRRKLTRKPEARPTGLREKRIFWAFTIATPIWLLFTVVQLTFFLRGLLAGLDLSWLGLPTAISGLVVWALVLAVVGVLTWPLVLEFITLGKDEEEVEEAVRRKRRRRKS